MTGIDRACLAYITHYQHRARAVVQRGGFTHVMGQSHSRRLYGLLMKPDASFRWRLVRLLAKSLIAGLVGGAPLRGTPYLNVGHTGLDRPGHARWVRHSGVHAYYYVYDLIPITHSAYARAGEPERHALRMASVLMCGRGVITCSEDSIAALGAFAQAQGLQMPPTLCAPLGVTRAAPAAASARPLAQSYFVVVGTIEGRKNHLLLLNVWRDLVRIHGQDAPKLVIIGQRGWSVENVTHTLDADADLRTHVIELGLCDDVLLWQYLRHAQALLFPSFAEGQGLPLIEALDAGTPVIASDLAVFRETAGDIPCYLNPHDRQHWAETIMAYCAPGSPHRTAQIARIASFQAPTWAAHFEAVEGWMG